MNYDQYLSKIICDLAVLLCERLDEDPYDIPDKKEFYDSVFYFEAGVPKWNAFVPQATRLAEAKRVLNSLKGEVKEYISNVDFDLYISNGE